MASRRSKYYDEDDFDDEDDWYEDYEEEEVLKPPPKPAPKVGPCHVQAPRPGWHPCEQHSLWRVYVHLMPDAGSGEATGAGFQGRPASQASRYMSRDAAHVGLAPFLRCEWPENSGSRTLGPPAVWHCTVALPASSSAPAPQLILANSLTPPSATAWCSCQAAPSTGHQKAAPPNCARGGDGSSSGSGSATLPV